MRSIRNLLVALATILALTGLAASVTASTPHTLTIVKDCTVGFTGKVGSYCTITESNVAQIPAGSRVSYYGPVLSSSVFVSSTAVISNGAANTASGYCQVDLRSGVGFCTFWKGTGTLTGFHAVINGSAESAPRYHWDGRYYFTGR